MISTSDYEYENLVVAVAASDRDLTVFKQGGAGQKFFIGNGMSEGKTFSFCIFLLRGC